jgi:hypothetical protein
LSKLAGTGITLNFDPIGKIGHRLSDACWICEIFAFGGTTMAAIDGRLMAGATGPSVDFAGAQAQPRLAMCRWIAVGFEPPCFDGMP